MSHHSMPMRLGVSILGLALVAAPATAQEEGTSPKPTTASKASKLFKKAASKAAKECKLNLKDVAKDACEDIDALRDELSEVTQAYDG